MESRGLPVDPSDRRFVHLIVKTDAYVRHEEYVCTDTTCYVHPQVLTVGGALPDARFGSVTLDRWLVGYGNPSDRSARHEAPSQPCSGIPDTHVLAPRRLDRAQPLHDVRIVGAVFDVHVERGGYRTVRQRRGRYRRNTPVLAGDCNAVEVGGACYCVARPEDAVITLGYGITKPKSPIPSSMSRRLGL